ncbi:replication protein A 70 kDa DNA-binding subunit B, partial [Tanacetum coccineum]
HQDACNREDLVNQFKDRLVEGSAVTLKRYSLREIQPNYHMVNTNLRLSFLSNTKVEPCTDFNGSLYGFDFRGYKSIADLKQEEDGQFDVIGHVVACEDLDNYDKLISLLVSPLFTVLRLSDDPEILDSIDISATPSKMDSEATSSALPTITPLDLESQTDENTTPINTKKNNAMDYVDKEASDGKNKRPAQNDISSDSSNGKKRAIKLKTEKEA